MAAPIEIPEHHIQQELCTTRPKYREGRELKAVKVYTVAQESKYLLVHDVPAVGAQQELVKLFAIYGTIEEYRILDDYPADEFTEVYWIKFQRIQSARFAKNKLDNYNFFGGDIHVCYAPEFESVDDTREKLQDRRKIIAAKTRHKQNLGSQNSLALQRGISSTNSQTTFSGDTDRIKTTDNQSTTNSDAGETASEIHYQEIPWNYQSHGQHRFHNGSYHPQFPHTNRNFIPQEQFSANCKPPRFQFFPPNPRSQQSHFGNSSNHQKPNNKTSTTEKDVHVPHNRTNNGGATKTGKQTASETRSNSERIIEGVVVRDYVTPSKAKPKFVPRQVKSASANKPEPMAKKTIPDELSQEIKRNACILGDVKGPALPDDKNTERKRTIEEEEEESVQSTVKNIREKVKMFSAVGPPPKVKKTKKS